MMSVHLLVPGIRKNLYVITRTPPPQSPRDPSIAEEKPNYTKKAPPAIQIQESSPSPSEPVNTNPSPTPGSPISCLPQAPSSPKVV